MHRIITLLGSLFLSMPVLAQPYLHPENVYFFESDSGQEIAVVINHNPMTEKKDFTFFATPREQSESLYLAFVEAIFTQNLYRYTSNEHTTKRKEFTSEFVKNLTKEQKGEAQSQMQHLAHLLLKSNSDGYQYKIITTQSGYGSLLIDACSLQKDSCKQLDFVIEQTDAITEMRYKYDISGAGLLEPHALAKATLLGAYIESRNYQCELALSGQTQKYVAKLTCT
ncbi:hypothetical protein J8M20_14780 [Pseudoalteromonas luteoviolacea]|uniref:hypothetical protein n=1 Tax=Pseudoalteromonas luteoviolacea TaxID=43657 RepID=UPI001B390CE1|nr:hypothetical protein [Pseudoalteromonas luteoviolacea]MBQ4812621.1 hypothetical protein [Pseudoalteromonas luteoviolacea]